MSSGLRERKKQQTRQAIHEAAMKLFAERGFDATTIADIAEAADVAPRTFFAYFPSKEDAVFPKYETAIAEFDRVLRDRAPGTTALEALRTWVESAAREYMPTPGKMLLEAKLRRESPAVAACDLRHTREFERRLAEAVGEDLGEPADALRPRLVAAAATAALTASSDSAEAVLEADPKVAEAMLADPMAFIDDALRFLEAGLAALRS
ncbi:MAG TPA: TetR family transcriptional regulator [Solirubrobacteraceae bacterium]|jgi:AcrR family transcriptional regulator|nr:TetR family transcriptional regulator [Solirubrobacteraceae bacterium]